jgi:AAA+ ATPase superfamily predicted ATPase
LVPIQSDEPGSRIGILYGRRRVGKTFLLKYAWGGRRHFYFLAAGTTPDQNRQDLIYELAQWAGEELRAEDYPTWRATFRLLGRFARQGPLIVVLDEFQYLMRGEEEGVTSQLNAVWERELAEVELTLILCGSEVGTMEGLAKGGALYGRIDWQARLRPFDYFDAARMAPRETRREDAYVYGIFGGIPRYLECVRSDRELSEAVIQSVLSPRGRVHLQIEHLIQQEEGLREPGEYRAVLAAIAQGGTRLNEIVHRAGMQDRDHSVRRILGILEDLQVIVRERDFGAGRTRAWRTFEDMTREAFQRQHDRWGLPAAAEWARWEGLDRNRRQIEIDIVAELTDRKLLTGEVKWSSSPVGEFVHEDLLRNLRDLIASGHGWASDALDPARSHGHLYVSAAGFTEEFVGMAKTDSRIRLVTLEDCYAGPQDP